MILIAVYTLEFTLVVDQFPLAFFSQKEFIYDICSPHYISDSYTIFASRVAQTLNKVCVPNSSSLLELARWHKSIICPGSVMCSCLSHHLSPWHGVLLVSRVPVSKIVHISSRVHWCTFCSHADVP